MQKLSFYNNVRSFFTKDWHIICAPLPQDCGFFGLSKRFLKLNLGTTFVCTYLVIVFETHGLNIDANKL
jgi:hypothetical protein